MILSGSSDIFFDTNGEKGPNKFGRDIFSFYILDSAPYDSKKSFPNPNLPHVNTFSPGFNGFCSNGKVNRNTLIENCKRFGTEPINSETAYCQCSILLEIDGWEFKNDYPFKL